MHKEQVTPNINKNEKKTHLVSSPYLREPTTAEGTVAVDQGSQPVQPYGGRRGVGLRVCGLGWQVLCGRVECRGHSVDGASPAADPAGVSSVLLNRTAPLHFIHIFDRSLIFSVKLKPNKPTKNILEDT